MIYYIRADDPDNRILLQMNEILSRGGLIALPTDTNWVLAAAFDSRCGMKELLKIKKISGKKNFSLLCRDLRQMDQFAQISTPIFKILKKLIPGPYTFIFKLRTDAPKILQETRLKNQVGCRIPNAPLCQKVVETVGYPLLVTTIDPALLHASPQLGPTVLRQGEPFYSYHLELAFPQVEMILDPGGDEPLMQQSTIIDLSNFDEDGGRILREGEGDSALVRSLLG